MLCRFNRPHPHGSTPPNRAGFTLIELMVTVAIIATLASMLLFGMVRAQNRAQVARTKATIVKLHDLMIQRWDSYSTRRVPVDTLGLSPLDAAEFRLVALRQLMRLEMPDRWSEVVTGPTDLRRINGVSFGAPLMTRPALSEAYLRYYNTVSVGKTAGNVPSTQFQGAECLYMIVTLGAMDEGSGRELFAETDVGDVDNDGAPEFLDAWGMPIRFLRWPVGFIGDPRQDSSAQARFGHLSDLMPPKNPSGAAAPLVPCKPDATAYHDPFDSRRLDSVAFTVYPLIYSAGPDRIEDIYSGIDTMVRDDPYVDLRNDTTPCAAYDPLAGFVEGTPSIGSPKWLGIPCDLNAYRYQTALPRNNKMNHYDNIHNHQVDATVR
ncbi:MAG: type II secretion system GspH family protein [Planctomycetia bacterium]|nr:type II secretion system GspH family protein [Planctomycetia bacterium]